MTKSETKSTVNSTSTPSMFASLLVFGVMIGLIVFSVIFFGDEVAAGPLQISMTLATLFALGVAYRSGFHGALISEAITHSINSALGTIFIPLAIGAFVIGALGLGMAYAPYAFLSYLSPLVTIFLAFVYLSKKTLPGDEDAEAVYGIDPEDADLPEPPLSA